MVNTCRESERMFSLKKKARVIIAGVKTKQPSSFFHLLTPGRCSLLMPARLGLLAAYISQSYLRYAVCVGKRGLESVVNADVVQNAHAELSLALVSCNINRAGGWMNK